MPKVAPGSRSDRTTDAEFFAVHQQHARRRTSRLEPIGSNQRHRMRGAAAFARIFRSGRRLDGQHLQILMSPAAGAVGCVGYVIGKKYLARAVDRNYLRRMMREAIRLRRPALDSMDVVVRLKRGCKPVLLRGLAAEAATLLDRLAENATAVKTTTADEIQ